jgi:hypothetical protein
MMKFVGFDDKGEIGNVVTLDYHIDEMGFRLSVRACILRRLTIGGALSLSSMIAGLPVCTVGIR